MAKKRTLPADAQAAAVRHMVGTGKSLDSIADEFAGLNAGIDAVRAETARPSARATGAASIPTPDHSAQF